MVWLLSRDSLEGELQGIMTLETKSTVVHSPSLWMKFSWSLAKQALALPVSPGLALRVEVPVHEEGLVVQGNPGHLLRLHQGRVQQGSLLIANVVPWPEPEKPTIAKVVYNSPRKRTSKY